MKLVKTTVIPENTQRYLVNAYGALNVNIVKSSCEKYNADADLCKLCKFFSTNCQEQSLGFKCPIWDDVFGSALQEAVIKYTSNKVILDASFITQWRARKVAPGGTKKSLVYSVRKAGTEGTSYAIPIIHLKDVVS